MLRLMENFCQHQVERVVAEELRLGAISFDALKMLLLARLENRPARLGLTFYPYLPAARRNGHARLSRARLQCRR